MIAAVAPAAKVPEVSGAPGALEVSGIADIALAAPVLVVPTAVDALEVLDIQKV